MAFLQEKQRQEQRQNFSCAGGLRSSNTGGASRLGGNSNRPGPAASPAAGRARVVDRSPVTAFLMENGLSQYVEVFHKSGFDDLETLVDIEEEHMKEMGMPAGHVVKLKKCIRKLAGGETASTAGVAGSVALVSSGRPWRLPQDMGKPAKPTTSQMTAVQLSWVQLQQVGTDVAGGLFYKKFFQLQPDAKRLFPMSVRMRYRDWASENEEDENDLDNSPALRKLWAKVIDAVGSAVAGMHDCNKLVPMLTQLGMRHVGYGLKPEYVQLAGRILIDVLKEALGDSCTKEVENTWVMVFGFMSATMLGGFRAMQEEIRRKEKMLSLSRTASDTFSNHSGGTGSVTTQDEELRAAQEAAEEEEKMRREAEEEEEMLRREAEDTIAPLKNLPSLLEHINLYGIEESNDKLQWDAAHGFC